MPADEHSATELLRNALVGGRNQDFDELLVLGASAVQVFQNYLSGKSKVVVPNAPGPWLTDNTTALSSYLAQQFPDEFLALFNSVQWKASGFALIGLGATRRSEAVPVLVGALFDDDSEFTRLRAAAALGSIPGRDSVNALMHALDDPKYLVQYHAIKSLGNIGDLAVADRLRAIVESSTNLGLIDVASHAVKAIEVRATTGSTGTE